MKSDRQFQIEKVSIPFIAGQWSLLNVADADAVSGDPVSIPFIAGQWSLHYFIHTPIVMPDGFQSPSLRGSGRFGSACRRRPAAAQVSIPFIAGQWSLP